MNTTTLAAPVVPKLDGKPGKFTVLLTLPMAILLSVSLYGLLNKLFQ